ncbi:MAG: threonylcarbamoyl-AMP synthase [Chloroflexi bacterium]|nr:threonylcarbamoyl-AMP synthase [Chloroflexota bacterium]
MNLFLSSQALPATLTDQVNAGVECLKTGGVVAFPTDTLYGLGADIALAAAVQRVLDIKGRPQQMGLPLLLSGTEQLSLVAEEVSESALFLANHFWPGALTLVVRRSALVSDMVTGRRDTVALRVPAHLVPIALARGLGRPITGTSANLTGWPPAATANEVRRQLGHRVDMVIDGGPSPLGEASTIVDVTSPVLKVVRVGAISLEALRKIYTGPVE